MTDSVKVEAAQSHFAFLAEASAILASSLDYKTTLANVVQLVLPFLADYCLLFKLEENGQIRPITVGSHDPLKEGVVQELASLFFTHIHNPKSLTAEVLRTGKPVLVSESAYEMTAAITDNPRVLELYQELDPKSLMIVPLSARGQMFGAMLLAVAESNHGYGASELSLAEELARRAAVAIANAQLYSTAQQARVEAEAARQQTEEALRQSEERYHSLVTERKQTEEALKLSEERLRLALKAARMVAWAWNASTDRIVRSETASDVLGLPPDSLAGTGEQGWNLVHPDDLAEHQATVQKAIASQGSYRSEFRTIRPDNGAVIWLEDRGKVTCDAAGNVVSIEGALFDITIRKQAELQLQESQRFIQQVADATPGILYIYDLIEQRNIYVNRQIAELLGYTPAQIQVTGSQLFTQLLHPEDLATLRAHLERFNLAEDGEIIEHEYRMRHVNGEWRWFWSRDIVFTRTKEGLPHQVLGTSHDITDRKRAEEELRRANERFELAAAAVNCLIYDWDVERNTVERTQGLTRILGYSLEEAEPTSDWWNDRIHPDDLPHARKQTVAALANGSRFATEYRVRNKENQYLYVLDQGIVVRDAEGRIVRVVGSTTDISDAVVAARQRKQAEEALRQSEARFRRLVESNIIGIVIADFHGNITYANDAFLQLVGYGQEDMRRGELRWIEMTPPEYRNLDEQALDEMTKSGVFTPFKKEYLCKDGSRVPILVGGALLEGYDDTVVAFVLDLTEQKRAESEREQLLKREQAAREEAEAANRVKDEFLAILSHELRSPLNAILGWSKMLRTRKFDQATINRALETIERNAQAQTQLIEDLLDVSRILRGKLSLSVSPVNPASPIQAAIDTMRPAAEAKSIQLVLSIDPNVGMVSGDASRLQQVVWNLLSNAIKFTPQGGRVEIRLSRFVGAHFTEISASPRLNPINPPVPELRSTDNYAQIQISDTGKGIRADFLPYVFDYFRQADASTTRNQGGLGLGLAIVRHLVELHGGTVCVESPGEGQGSTFTVRLPLMQVQPEANRSNELLDSSANLNGIKVLVVDDEIDSREFLVFALEQYGAIAIEATSVREALESLKQFQPDVLISDIGMPEEDGYTLIRQVRTLSPNQGGNIPAVALTAYARAEDRTRAIDAGFQMHLSKPIEPAKLITTVASLANCSL